MAGNYVKGKRDFQEVHGLSRHPLYNTWASMIKRCTNTRCKDFPNYGGRGITVCERWAKSPSTFISDMGDKPSGYSLERIDNDGGYSPENCVWASRMEQMKNKRDNTYLTHNGRTLHLSEWARISGFTPQAITKRLARGWSIEDAITKPIRNTKAHR